MIVNINEFLLVSSPEYFFFRKIVGFWGNFPSMFTLSRYDLFFKSPD